MCPHVVGRRVFLNLDFLGVHWVHALAGEGSNPQQYSKYKPETLARPQDSLHTGPQICDIILERGWHYFADAYGVFAGVIRAL